MKLFIAFFAGIAGIAVLSISYGIGGILAGRFIKKRKYRWFILAVAVPRTLFIPYETLLSVLTFILLEQDSVKEKYANQAAD